MGEDLGKLNDSIRSILGVDHPVLSRVAKYFFDFDGGKKLRPALVLLMSRAVNQHIALENAERAAAATAATDAADAAAGQQKGASSSSSSFSSSSGSDSYSRADGLPSSLRGQVLAAAGGSSSSSSVMGGGSDRASTGPLSRSSMHRGSAASIAGVGGGGGRDGAGAGGMGGGMGGGAGPDRGFIAGAGAGEDWEGAGDLSAPQLHPGIAATGARPRGGYTASPPLVASFAALPELLTSFPAVSTGDHVADASAGLQLQYMPAKCQLAVGGGRAPYVRIWDLAAERCSAVLPLNAGPGMLQAAGAAGGLGSSGIGAGAGGGGGWGSSASVVGAGTVSSTGAGSAPSMHVTSLSSAWPGTDVLIAGTSNGAIQVLDTRLGAGLAGGGAGPVVMSMREHRKWVVNVAQARSGSVYAMVSGSVTADVRFWDLRRPQSVHSIQAHRSPMTSLALHDYAPLIATGTRKQQVKLWSNSGELISEIRYHDGFLGQRIGPVSSLAFHPHRLYMAVGALDSIVSLHHGLPAASFEGND